MQPLILPDREPAVRTDNGTHPDLPTAVVLIGCGGNEHYGDTAVLRSVVVHERARGLGLGIEIGRLLIEDARASGASDLYLFTLDAYEFWKRLGFADLELSKWHQDTREQWQYHWVSTYPQAAADVHAMWRAATP